MIRVAFLESICTNEAMLMENYRSKLRNDDYASWSEEAALQDFTHRIQQYEKVYETVDDSEDKGNVSYMKILNCGAKTVHRNCQGFLISKISGFLLNLHLENRVIYFSRHGESEDNAAGRLGRDSPLTEAGVRYGQRLRDFLKVRLSSGFTDPAASPSKTAQRPTTGWLLVTSDMQRTQMTAAPLLADSSLVKSGLRRMHTALLNEISCGKYEGYTPEEIEREAPEEQKSRRKDKLRYRFPKGEGYIDVVHRVRPVAIEME